MGAKDGLPGVTVGKEVVGPAVLGLRLGDPGVTVGTPVVGAAAGLAVEQSYWAVITRSSTPALCSSRALLVSTRKPTDKTGKKAQNA